MKIVSCVDIFPWTTGKGDVYFACESGIQGKQERCKRYKVVVEVPDFHEVDAQIGPNKSVEVSEVVPSEDSIPEVPETPVEEK